MPLRVDHPRPIRLRQIQQLVGTAIFRPLTPAYRTQKKWIDGRDTADVADTIIRPNERLTSLERLEIYNRQYWFRIIDCFHDDFPGLRAILGKSRFQHLARAYLAECPSKSFTLRNLGQFLPDFLQRHPHLTKPYTAQALDMVRLEWAQIEAFDGPSFPPLTLADVQATPPDRLRLTLQPNSSLLTVSYAVDDYLLAVRKILKTARPNTIPTIRRRPKKEKAHILIHRHDNSVYYKRLSRLEFLVLSALKTGQPLAQALATTFEQLPPHDLPSPEQIRDWFQSWTTVGWLLCSN